MRNVWNLESGSRTPSRDPQSGRTERCACARCLAVAVIAGAHGLAAAAPAGAAARSAPVCAAGSAGVVATLGTWSDEQDPIDRPGSYGRGDGPFLIEVAGFGTGLGRLAATGEDVVPGALRIVPRTGGGRRLELCEGRGLIAVGPSVPKETKVGGLSLSGDRIAWRTWRPGRRGVVSIGRVVGRRITGVRTASAPVLPRSQAVNGRILVTPAGTAAWSLETKGRAAVWLWPHDRPVRQLTLPGDRRRTPGGWDVRIVDDRHVLLGRTETVLRYGPTTPGSCPVPVGATDVPFAGGRLVRVPEAVFRQSTDVARWSHTLLCDPAAGDYIDMHASRSSGGKYGESSGADALAALSTAGVLVHVDAANAYGAPMLSTVVVRATRQTTVASGGVADTTAPASAPPLALSLNAPTRIGLAIVPGVVAWIAAAPARFDSDVPKDRRVWLADAAGARIVGVLPDEGTDDPRLAVTDGSLTWSDGATTRTIPVTPALGSVVERVMLSD